MFYYETDQHKIKIWKNHILIFNGTLKDASANPIIRTWIREAVKERDTD